MATLEGPAMSVEARSSRSGPGTLEFAISGRIAPEDVAALCDCVCTELQCHPGARIVCDVGAVVASDAVAVEALARLQLGARRLGCSVDLRNASRELLDLLALVGLSEVLPASDS